jgi:hypothetical protein
MNPNDYKPAQAVPSVYYHQHTKPEFLLYGEFLFKRALVDGFKVIDNNLFIIFNCQEILIDKFDTKEEAIKMLRDLATIL